MLPFLHVDDANSLELQNVYHDKIKVEVEGAMHSILKMSILMNLPARN